MKFYRVATVVAIVSSTVLLGVNSARAAAPQRIISLSPSATEDLFAIGAGAQVLAVDDLSNYPAIAPISKLSAFSPNVEALVAYKPDLIILNSTATKAEDVRKQLTKLGISIYWEISPNSLSDAYAEITALGKLTGRAKEAAGVVAEMKKRITATVSAHRKGKSVTIFHELDNTLYSATSETFIGSVYRSFNLNNIADAAATADSYGYPQLTSEYIVKVNPRIIYLADAEFGESLKSVSSRPGWKNITAVRKKQILALPTDIPSRWGPRLADFYEFVGQSLAKLS
jgi:iron complex transport system substrate-binding protein